MASRGGGGGGGRGAVGGRGAGAKRGRGRGGKNPGKHKRSIWANSSVQAPGEDREISCKDCSSSFTFTARAQALHAEQGYGDPVRCQNCRKAKRERNEADASAQASGQPRAGLTYEEKRVLGKNRKERRADAAASGDLLRNSGNSGGGGASSGDGTGGASAGSSAPTFAKGMDPQEARLLRLAREGKMKRAMHKPEERANFNTVQERLEKQGEAAAASQPASSTREGGGRPIHKRIRDLERRLARGNLPDELRVQKENEVKQLRQQQQEERFNSAEEKIARRYKMVKFFEERKLIRRIRSAQKRKSAATTPEAIAAVDAETAQLHEDLEYVTNYPRAKKYVSLFPKGGLDEYGRGEVAKMRAEIKEIMRQRGGESERSAAARAEAAGLAAAAAAEIDAKDEAEAVSLMAPRPPPICN
jgi:hypothetical protein